MKPTLPSTNSNHSPNITTISLVLRLFKCINGFKEGGWGALKLHQMQLTVASNNGFTVLSPCLEIKGAYQMISEGLQSYAEISHEKEFLPNQGLVRKLGG